MPRGVLRGGGGVHACARARPGRNSTNGCQGGGWIETCRPIWFQIKKSFGREGERKKITVDGLISGLCCCCRDGGVLVGKRQPPVSRIYIQLETKVSVAFC